MNLNCKICNYSARDNFNYNKHLLTKKHIEKVNQIANDSITAHKPPQKKLLKNDYICQYCNKIYASATNLARHDKACFKKNKLIIDYEQQLNEQIKITQQKEELLKQKDELISQVKSENAHLKVLINSSGTIIKTSVSSLAYVVKNYKDAPALESIKDYSALRYEQTNTEFVENLIHEHNHDKLYTFIGDFIIKTYKKNDPSQQSIWNSDTSRLTYIIRQIIIKNEMDWKVDKKGIQTSKFVIKPLVEYIDTEIRDYIQNFKVNHDDSPKETERKMTKMMLANEILQNIEDKVLENDILKYITPYFHLSKSELICNDVIDQ